MKNLFYKSIRLLIILSFLQTTTRCTSRNEAPERIPILIVSDIGKDIDDALAISWAATNPHINLTGVIITTLDNPNAQKSLSEIGHLTKNSLNIIDSRDTLESNRKISQIFSAYRGELRIVILAQAGPISNFLISHPQFQEEVHSIYIQAYPSETSPIRPNFSSYNFAIDSIGAELLFESTRAFPRYFIGKYAAYQLPFTKFDFKYLKNSSLLGDFLYKEAIEGIERFARSNPSLFYKLFAIPSSLSIEEALEFNQTLSYPYDLLTVASVLYHSYFNFVKIGNDYITGESLNRDNIAEIALLKRELIRGFEAGTPLK